MPIKGLAVLTTLDDLNAPETYHFTCTAYRVFLSPLYKLLSIRSLSVCSSVRPFVCRLLNLLSHSLRGSTWRRAGAYRIDSDYTCLACDKYSARLYHEIHVLPRSFSALAESVVYTNQSWSPVVHISINMLIPALSHSRSMQRKSYICLGVCWSEMNKTPTHAINIYAALLGYGVGTTGCVWRLL